MLMGLRTAAYERPLIEKASPPLGLTRVNLPNHDERWVRLRAQPQTESCAPPGKLARSQKRPVPLAVMVGHPWHYRV